jgi:hypothetical protein
MLTIKRYNKAIYMKQRCAGFAYLFENLAEAAGYIERAEIEEIARLAKDIAEKSIRMLRDRSDGNPRNPRNQKRGAGMTTNAHNRSLPALFARVWRIRLGRYAMKITIAFAAASERLYPEDLRR